MVLTQLRNNLSSNVFLKSVSLLSVKDRSTETAVLSVLDDLLVSADERLVSLVALLDPSASFDNARPYNIATTA